MFSRLKRRQAVRKLVPNWSDNDLDAEFVFDRYIGSDETLAHFQQLLEDTAPGWVGDLRIWRSAKDQRSVAAAEPDSFRSAILAAAAERGPTYRQLVEQLGQPLHERLFGDVALHGRSRVLTVVVRVDEMVASRIGSRVALGNGITLQVRGPRVERRESWLWLRDVFLASCEKLSPAWASAQTVAEYWAKVMRTDDRIEAVGRDFGRHLPGLFWLNYFGDRYGAFVGRDRLLSTPGVSASEVGEGILISVGEEPTDWASRARAHASRRAVDHLGPGLFFDREQPNRPGRAPGWLT